MSFERLQQWHELYSVTAEIAATLMGLMFVVISLGRRSAASEALVAVTRALHTPIVVFFVTVIAVSILMLMPNTGTGALGALLGAASIGGLIYMIASGAYRVWREYELDTDDLVWYVLLPYLSYAALGAAAVMIWRAIPVGPHVEAGVVVLFLFIGIRNAWDLVTYTVRRGPDD